METNKLLAAVDVRDLIGQVETLIAAAEQFGEQSMETMTADSYRIALEELQPHLPTVLRAGGEERGKILATRCWELYAITKWQVLVLIATVARPVPSFYPSMRLVVEGKWYVATFPAGEDSDPEASAKHQLEVLRMFWRNDFEILPFHVHIRGFEPGTGFVSQWEKGKGVSIWEKLSNAPQ